MSSSGCGALVAAVYLASRESVSGLGKVMTFSGFILAIAIISFAQVSSVGVALPVLFCIGLSMVLLTASANTLLQSLCDSSKLGRVMSFFSMAFSGVIPIGSLFAGYGAETLGIKTTLTISGIIILVGTSVLASKLPTLRRKAHPVFIEKGIISQIPGNTPGVS